MELIKIIILAFSLSFPAMKILQKTPLKNIFNSTKIYFMCVGLYMALEGSYRLIQIIY
jgi:hypothetical protein